MMRKKKSILRLVTTMGLLALMLVPASLAAADNAVSVGVTTTQVPEGGDFTATIYIDYVANFDAAQYDITYDPAVIEVTGVTDGDIGGTTIPVAMWASVNSTTIRVINNVPDTSGVSGSGYLAVIHFHVKEGSAGTSSDIDLSHGLLGNTSAQKIEGDTWSGTKVYVVTSMVADFYADETEVLVDQDVNFTDNTTGGTTPYTYEWDFDNDATIDSTDANPTHSYTASGNYTVVLTVTDSDSNSDTETKTNFITVYEDLVAGCSANISEAVVGENITFLSSTTTGGKPGYDYEWDFNDGSANSNDPNPSHSFAASGNYTVSLTVTDGLGNTDTNTVDVNVYKLGDANKSNAVNILDVIWIEKIILEETGYEYTTWADAKQDGNINALDITATELIIIGGP